MHCVLINFVLGTYVDMGIWSSAEISAAIVSACLPTLRPLFGRSKNGTTSGAKYATNPSVGASQQQQQPWTYRVNGTDPFALHEGLKRPARAWTSHA